MMTTILPVEVQMKPTKTQNDNIVTISFQLFCIKIENMMTLSNVYMLEQKKREPSLSYTNPHNKISKLKKNLIMYVNQSKTGYQ